MKTVVGMSSLPTRGVRAPMNGLSGRRTAVRRVASKAARKETTMSGQAFDKDWLMASPFATVCGVVGWVAPSSIPVSAFDGNSLFGALLSQIGKEWAHFPTGPALDSPFWLYLITWHLGLFVTMTLAQIGYNGYKQGYFD